jgi:hypothetical protein
MTLLLFLFATAKTFAMTADCAAWLNSSGIGQGVVFGSDGTVEAGKGYRVEEPTKDDKRLHFVRKQTGVLPFFTLSEVFVDRENKNIKSITSYFKGGYVESIYLADDGKNCYPKAQYSRQEGVTSLDWDTKMCGEINAYFNAHPELKVCGESGPMKDLKEILDKYKPNGKLSAELRYGSVTGENRKDFNPIAAAMGYTHVCNREVFSKFARQNQAANQGSPSAK